MNKYSIWSEGYNATGQRSGAHFHGVGYGETFEEACKDFFKVDRFFNSNTMSYWGCKVFDNETDARSFFG